MLARRLLTAAIGLPLGILVLYLGGVWVTLGIGAFSFLALGEYFSAAGAKGLTPHRTLAYAFVAGFLATAHFAKEPLTEIVLCFLVAVLTLASLAAPALKGRTTWAIASSSVTLTAALYVGFLFSFLVLLRNRPGETHSFAPFHVHLQAGFVYVFYLIAVSWLTDTGAFFIGGALGARKLAPRISPNKTLEGSAGGLLVALVVGIPLGTWMGLAPQHAAILALLGGVIGQIGDLAKSALKRDVGIKDFGTLFPGHGGVLDRFDSVLFNAPLFYFYLRLVGL